MAVNRYKIVKQQNKSRQFYEYTEFEYTEYEYTVTSQDKSWNLSHSSFL